MHERLFVKLSTIVMTIISKSLEVSARKVTQKFQIKAQKSPTLRFYPWDLVTHTLDQEIGVISGRLLDNPGKLAYMYSAIYLILAFNTGKKGCLQVLLIYLNQLMCKSLQKRRKMWSKFLKREQTMVTNLW